MEITINGISPNDCKITINGIDYKPVTEPDYFTVSDVYYHYLGTKEYDGIIATIQRWYYGTLVKDSWCATSMSWALAQLGLREYTLKGKYENVYLMNNALSQGVSDNRCERVNVNDLRYGDILIFCWDDNFSLTAGKHITSYVERYDSNYVKCIGGNQNDGIFEKNYPINKIVTGYRPRYDLGTLKKLSLLPEE